MVFFRHIFAFLLVSCATGVRTSTNEDEGYPWHHTWCNPFSGLPDKTYRMELNVGENQDVIMELRRRSDSLSLRLVDGHYRVWLPKDAAETHVHDLVFERYVTPESTFDVTLDLVRDVRYLRRTRFGAFGDHAPSALEVQWINGAHSEFAGGVWYPPRETLASGQALFVPNGTGVLERNMTSFLDGRELDSIPLRGMSIQDMNLDAASNSALLGSTLSELVGIALDGANPAMYATHAFTETTAFASWAISQHNIHYAASDKWFDKLWCHPLYKRCDAEGVIVPKDRSCPQTDNAGRLLPPGHDGPSNFMFVAETSECGGAQEPVRSTSMDLIQQVFHASANDQPGCFHLESLSWDPSLPPQWYKIWCDTETGVAGLMSFTNSGCDVNNGDWANVWQLSTNICFHDEVRDHIAKTHCQAI